MAFSTFPLPDPSSFTVAEAEARLAAQKDMVDELMRSIGANLGERFQQQAQMSMYLLNKVKAPIKANLRAQKEMVNQLKTNLIVQAGQRLANQRAMVGQLRGALFAAGESPPDTSVTGPAVVSITPPTNGALAGEVNVSGGVIKPTGAITPCSLGETLLGGDCLTYYATCDSNHVGPPMVGTVITHPDGSATSSFGYGTPNPSYYSIAPGAFGTQAEAQAYIDTNAGYLCGPTTPGTGPTTPVGVTDAAVCCPFETVDIPDDPGISGVPDLDIMAGEVSTFAVDRVAAAGCAGAGGGAFAIPVPGSRDWCILEDRLKRIFTCAGQNFLNWIKGVVTDGMVDGKEDKSAWDEWVDVKSPILAGLRQVMRVLNNMGLDARKRIAQMFIAWENLANIPSSCSGSGLVAMAALRAVLRWARDLRIGLNFGVEITLSLIVDIPQLQRAVDYLYESMCPSVIPGVGEATTCYNMDTITEEMYRCWLNSHGVDQDVHEYVRQATAPHLPMEQVILYDRLLGLPENFVDDDVKRHGYVHDKERERLISLYDASANWQQWLAWEKADATNDDFARLFQLDTGFDDFWASQAGIESFARGTRKQDAQRDWRMSLNVPGRQEMQRLMWELFPGRPGVPNPVGPEAYRAAVKAENWSPLVEQWYLENAFRFFSIAEARVAWHRDLIADGDFRDVVIALGLRDGPQMVQELVETQDKRRHQMAEIGGWTLPTLTQGVQWQQLDPAVASAELTLQGYTPAQLDALAAASDVKRKTQLAQRGQQMAQRMTTRLALQGYTIGTVGRDAALSALKKAGWLDSSAQAVIAAYDAQEKMKLAQKALTVVQKAYMTGEVNGSEADALLVQAGFVATRAAQYVAEWTFARSNTKKTVAGAQWLKWVQEGLVDSSAARTALENMGWRNPELALLLAENSQKIAKALAAAEAKQDAAAAKKAAALAHAAALAAKAQHAIQTAAQRSQPVAALKAEFIDGIITESYARSQLLAYGYSPGTIDAYILNWSAIASGVPASKAPPAP